MLIVVCIYPVPTEWKRRNLELKPIESMIYELIKKISILENSKYKPVPKIYYTNKSHVAIDGYNYELALNIAGEFSKTKNILLKDNILYQVLKLFNRILQDKEYNRDEYIEILTELISEKDITNLIICLKNYLNMIKKIEYFDLFIAIYKLSIWDNDYQDINNLLKNIDDILNYEKYVNRCLNSDNEEEIKLCLNILEIMHNFVDFEINELKERIFNQDLIIDLGKINELNEYIEKMYQQLLNNKSMVLLDRLDDDWHDYVISLMSKKNNVKVIEIDLDLEKRIVLIHVEKIEKFNKNLLMLESEKAYKEKRYRDSIEIQKQLLHDNFVQALYFELIGKSYYRLGLYNLALDYYLVALGLNMKENKISNVNELIKSLKKEIR